MTLQEAYEQKRQENLALKREVRRLEKKLDQAASGLFTVDEKVALIKQINQLTRQLKKAEKDRDRYRNMWKQGDQEYEEDHSRYYEENERRLLNRIQKYRENYFMWVSDFTLPTTNNLSERSLRFAKVHEKVSGQFESLAYARYFSMIRTYLETCTRNGINEFTALLRLTEENPFTLQEVLANSGS